MTVSRCLFTSYIYLIPRIGSSNREYIELPHGVGEAVSEPPKPAVNSTRSDYIAPVMGRVFDDVVNYNDPTTKSRQDM